MTKKKTPSSGKPTKELQNRSSALKESKVPTSQKPPPKPTPKNTKK